MTEQLSDGSVIFAITVESGQESSLLNASTKAITWTNADGTQGRKDVLQR